MAGCSQRSVSLLVPVPVSVVHRPPVFSRSPSEVCREQVFASSRRSALSRLRISAAMGARAVPCYAVRVVLLRCGQLRSMHAIALKNTAVRRWKCGTQRRDTVPRIASKSSCPADADVAQCGMFSLFGPPFFSICVRSLASPSA